MGNFDWAYGFLTEGFEVLSIALWVAAIVFWGAQLYFYIFRYGRVASFRNRNILDGGRPVAVSVIVPIFQADFRFLNEILPRIFAQSLAEFEVVVVNVAPDEDFAEQLKLLKITNPDHFTFTRLKIDPLCPITTKMALNVGIKAARYEHLIFTLSDCAPRSEHWLETLSRGFSGGDVVLGYSAIEPRDEFTNRIIRCSTVATSARWLSEAMAGRPYRGTLCNMGFTKKAYFDAKGFNYLNLNMGEDDLFIMKIARADNTNIIVNGSATVAQTAWGGLDWWAKTRRSHNFTHAYYQRRVKMLVGTELWTRELFFLLSLAALVFTPLYGKLLAAALLLLRFAVVMFEMRRVCRRMNESGLLSAYPVYDLCSPPFEAWLTVARWFTPRHKWK